jgi:RNA polymerase sigma factor (sigma-70 family)
VVLAAGQSDPRRQVEALEKLCRAYWYPIYSHVRQRGYGAEDAQDLTQEFLARLLEKNWLEDIDPHTGRFRSFLLTVLNRFLMNEYDRRQAAKRGGGQRLLSLDGQQAEGRYAQEAATDETPENYFDRSWALALLDQALLRLREETDACGKLRQFDLLNPFLSREAEAGEYTTIGAELGMSDGAVGVAVHRLRQRYREAVREEIANTIVDPARVDEEMRHLLAALRGQPPL